MVVESLGHAGLQIAHRGSFLQIDPWLTTEGAFQASWFQWPDNSHLLDHLPPPDAVAISHEHLDHVDSWWLGQLPMSTPVYVPRYLLGVLRQKVAASGLTRIREMDAWQEVEVLPGLKLLFVPERSPMNHDAAMVLQSGDQVIVSLNDARLCPLQIREIRSRVGRVDLLTLQGSGASWYPMAYHYPDQQKKILSFRKRMAKFGYLAQAARAADACRIIPFAGPPAFLDTELFHLNKEMDEGIFPDPEQVTNWMRQQGFCNVEFLNPGDQIDLDTGKLRRDAHWKDFFYSDRERHLASYASRRQRQIETVKARYPTPEENLWPVFRAYFEDLLTYSEYFNERIGMKVGFQIMGPGGGTWSVDFRNLTRGVYCNVDEIAYCYRFQSRWLAPLLRRSIRWEDFMLSCRVQLWRDPDLYNDHLLGLLKFADRPSLAAVEEWEKSSRGNEKIKVRSGARVFEIQRFCPHAGQDLLEAGEILAGDILRCNGHHYEFDLNSGVCINGKLAPLATRMLHSPTDADAETIHADPD
jgi:UDP-MurNAc hydroxylase